MYVTPPQFATICFREIPLVSTLMAVFLGNTVEKSGTERPILGFKSPPSRAENSPGIGLSSVNDKNARAYAMRQLEAGNQRGCRICKIRSTSRVNNARVPDSLSCPDASLCLSSAGGNSSPAKSDVESDAK
jgi:hypothetical protein